MSRRRRGTREPAFSFDSFVDLVTNLVGIVIRLILVVMVGAHLANLPSPAPETEPPDEQALVDTSQRDLERCRNEVADLQGRLLEILRALESTQQEEQKLQTRRREVLERQATANRLLAETEARIAAHQSAATQTEQDIPRLRERLAELHKAVKELEGRPPERELVRFHLPVSRLVDAEELIFECQQGRVTFADVQALLELVKKGLPDKGAELRQRRELTESVGPVEAFRLQYTLARERSSALDQAFSSLPPADDRRFDYGLRKWELVPIWPLRGESGREALADRSRFRQVVDGLDPEQVTLTFFVYPDSFELYRTLRDALYERGFVVAGRPLPPGVPIFGSRLGSVSRGQ